MVKLRAEEVSEPLEKIDKLTGGVDAKDLELQSMLGIVAETAILHEEASKLCEIAKNGEAIVAVLIGLQKELLAVKKAVPELLPVAEKTQNVRVDAEKKVISL